MIKSLVSLLLSAAIALNAPVVFADAKSDAEAILAKSDEAARIAANDLFRYYLMTGLMDNMVQTGVLSSANDALSAVFQDLDAYRKKANEATMNISSAIELLAEEELSRYQFRGHLSQAIKAYDEAQIQAAGDAYMMNSAESVALDTRQTVVNILKHLKDSCQLGVGKQFYIPALNGITIRPPGFSVGFNVKMSIDGSDIGSDVEVTPHFTPSMSEFWQTEDAGEYAAAGQTLLTLGIQQLLIASKVAAMKAAGYSAAQIAATTGSASTMAATAAMATVYAAVVMIIIYVVIDFIQRDKARKQADAVESSVRNRATSITVAKYYRELCSEYATPLLNLPEEIKILDAAPAGSPELLKLEEDRAVARAHTDKLSELLAAVESDRKKLVEQKLSPEVLHEKLSELKSAEDLKKYTQEELGFKGLISILRIQLIDLAKGATDSIALAQKLKGKIAETDDQEKSIRDILKEQRRRLQRLFSVSYNQSLEDLSPGAIAALQLEMKIDANVAAVYARWQDLYSKYLAAIFNGRGTEELRAELQILKEYVNQVRRESPSDVLDLIANRISALSPKGAQ